MSKGKTTTKNTNLLGNFQNTGNYNPSFVDVHGAFGAGAANTIKSTPKNNPEQSYSDRIASSKIKEGAKSIDFNYDAVPPELLPQVKSHLFNLSIQRAGENYMEAESDDTDIISRVTRDQNKDVIDSGVEKLKEQFTLLKNVREGWSKDEKSNAISSLISTERRQRISDFVNNKIPMSFTADGRIMFSEGEETFGVEDMPGYFNKDYTNANAMLTNYTNVFDAGEEFTDATRQLHNNQFNEMLLNGGDQTLLSLAFDDVGLETQEGGLLGTQAQWQTQIDAINGNDPIAAEEARGQIKTALEESYMTTLEEQANKGKAKKDLLKKDKKDWTKSQLQVIQRKKERHAALNDPTRQTATSKPVVGYTGSGVVAKWFDATSTTAAGYMVFDAETNMAIPTWKDFVFNPDDPTLHRILRIED